MTDLTSELFDPDIIYFIFRSVNMYTVQSSRGRPQPYCDQSDMYCKTGTVRVGRLCVRKYAKLPYY